MGKESGCRLGRLMQLVAGVTWKVDGGLGWAVGCGQGAAKMPSWVGLLRTGEPGKYATLGGHKP